MPLSVHHVYFLLFKCYPLLRVSFLYLNERMNECLHFTTTNTIGLIRYMKTAWK